jgi:hypothetical protein
MVGQRRLTWFLKITHAVVNSSATLVRATLSSTPVWPVALFVAVTASSLPRHAAHLDPIRSYLSFMCPPHYPLSIPFWAILPIGLLLRFDEIILSCGIPSDLFPEFKAAPMRLWFENGSRLRKIRLMLFIFAVLRASEGMLRTSHARDLRAFPRRHVTPNATWSYLAASLVAVSVPCLLLRWKITRSWQSLCQCMKFPNLHSNWWAWAHYGPVKRSTNFLLAPRDRRVLIPSQKFALGRCINVWCPGVFSSFSEAAGCRHGDFRKWNWRWRAVHTGVLWTYA